MPKQDGICLKMPVIEISKRDLCSLIGKNPNTKELEELLHFAKATLESEEGDILRIEIGDIDRPDLWSAEGLARIIKGQIGRESGLPKLQISRSNYLVKVEGKVARARPLIVCAVVKNLKLNEFSINQVIQLQEKLCEGFGLKRKEAALGIYDFDKINWPVKYTTFPRTMKFVPLEMNEPLTLNEILQKHEKGRQYAHLLQGCKEYPILIDSANEVLSMPPIINSDFTGKVTDKTRNVFIEVTGFSYHFIVPVLNVMVSALAERGGKIEQITIKTPQGNITTPDFTPKSAVIEADYCNNIIGLQLNSKQICMLLEKARFNAKQEGNKIIAYYLPYRQDIMDARDVIEDIAIAYGYEKLQPQEAKIPSTGKASDIIPLKQKITEILVGLNMQETATFTLTNKQNLFKKMNVEDEDVIEIANPISENYECIRNSLIPSALEFLSGNTKKEFPQRIFEIGECFSIKEEKTKNSLVIAITHAKTNFTEIKQTLDYLMKNLNVKCSIRETQHQTFIEGRVGSITINNIKAGTIGEIHPKVLSSWGLEMPVALLEIDLDMLKIQ